MRGWRRVRDGLLGLAVATLGLACGNSREGDVVLLADGFIAGLVLTVAGTPAAGVPVSVEPASRIAPGTTATGQDGRFSLRAPAGTVSVTIGGGPVNREIRSAAVDEHQTTPLEPVVVTADGREPVGTPPEITSAGVGSAVVPDGGTVAVTATVSDTDTSPDDLLVTAFATGPGGELLAGAPMSLPATRQTGEYRAELTLSNATGESIEATVTVHAVDSPGSGVGTRQIAGTVTVQATAPAR